MSKEVNRAIGGRIAKLRRHRGLTQAELAEAIGVANETISRLERGVSVPSLNTLEEISRSLDVPLKDFFDLALPPKKAGPSERTTARIIALLKGKRPQELRLAHALLRELFRGIRKPA
jgi:transcriptional regulator with XRE-family HTH domain